MESLLNRRLKPKIRTKKYKKINKVVAESIKRKELIMVAQGKKIIIYKDNIYGQIDAQSYWCIGRSHGYY